MFFPVKFTPCHAQSPVFIVCSCQAAGDIRCVCGDLRSDDSSSNVIDVWQAWQVGLLDDLERRYGDYSRGRFAWRLSEARVFDPIPFKGSLGLFDVPDDIVAEALEGAKP